MRSSKLVGGLKEWGRTRLRRAYWQGLAPLRERVMLGPRHRAAFWRLVHLLETAPYRPTELSLQPSFPTYGDLS